MKTTFKCGMLLVALAVTAFADTLILKDGTQVTGYYQGGTSRLVRFETDSGIRAYDLFSVSEIRFGGNVVKAAQKKTPREPLRLLNRDEAARRGSSPRTANTIPRGSSMLVRLVDSIQSEENEAGQTFRATLEDPLVVEGIEVVPADAKVRGRIVEVEGAGRIRGSAELRLELIQIVVNGIAYALTTSEYEEVGEGRGGQTATRVGTGASLGALVGLIAGGGKGAAIGAGVGAGAAGAVQVLTKGEKLYVPAETLLEFTLQQPLLVATR